MAKRSDFDGKNSVCDSSVFPPSAKKFKAEPVDSSTSFSAAESASASAKPGLFSEKEEESVTAEQLDAWADSMLETIRAGVTFNCAARARFEPSYRQVGSGGSLSAKPAYIRVHDYAPFFSRCAVNQHSGAVSIKRVRPFECTIKLTNSGVINVVGAMHPNIATAACQYVLNVLNERHLKTEQGVPFYCWIEEPKVSHVNKSYSLDVVNLTSFAQKDIKQKADKGMVVQYSPMADTRARIVFLEGVAFLSRKGTLIVHACSANICDTIYNKIRLVSSAHRLLSP